MPAAAAKTQPAAQHPPDPVLILVRRYKALFDEMTKVGDELIEGHIDVLKQMYPCSRARL